MGRIRGSRLAAFSKRASKVSGSPSRASFELLRWSVAWGAFSDNAGGTLLTLPWKRLPELLLQLFFPSLTARATGWLQSRCAGAPRRRVSWAFEAVNFRRTGAPLNVLRGE